MTRIIRVFPRRTKATPDDRLAYVGLPDLFPIIPLRKYWDRIAVKR